MPVLKNCIEIDGHTYCWNETRKTVVRARLEEVNDGSPIPEDAWREVTRRRFGWNDRGQE